MTLAWASVLSLAQAAARGGALFPGVGTAAGPPVCREPSHHPGTVAWYALT
jgi:hypothetical protein